jgi:hypothetical protein
MNRLRFFDNTNSQDRQGFRDILVPAITSAAELTLYAGARPQDR